MCLSSSITHESPVYLVNNGGVQPFLSLCGKSQLLCRLKMGNSIKFILEGECRRNCHCALRIRHVLM